MNYKGTQWGNVGSRVHMKERKGKGLTWRSKWTCY